MNSKTKLNTVVDAVRKIKLNESKQSTKITRNAFLYLEPRKVGEKFAQCETCNKFLGDKCAILGPKVKITKGMSCGFYLEGTPIRGMKSVALVTPDEAGLVDEQVRCENCRFGGPKCKLYMTLNKMLPNYFDLDENIKGHGCCNAFTK